MYFILTDVEGFKAFIAMLTFLIKKKRKNNNLKQNASNKITVITNKVNCFPLPIVIYLER